MAVAGIEAKLQAPGAGIAAHLDRDFQSVRMDLYQARHANALGTSPAHT